MTRSTTTTISLLATLALLLAACGGEEAGQGELDEQGDLAERSRGQGGLKALGVDTTQSDRLDPNGKPLPKDYHPLTKKSSALGPLCEIYFSGVTINGRSQALLDDGTKQYAELYSDSDGSWAKAPHASGKADVDGDGFDEIVVAYYVANDKTLKLNVIDRAAGGSYSASTSTLASGVEGSTQLLMGLASGDLDQDGLDELALAVGEKLYIVDDQKAKLAIVASKDFKVAGSSGALRLLSAAIGDFDGDGKAQLYVIHSVPGQSLNEGYASYYLYDGALLQERKHGLLTHLVSGSAQVITLARVAAGDIDGDKLDELVINAYSTKSIGLVFAIDDQKSSKTLAAAHSHTDMFSVLVNGVNLADVDGDATQEIFTGKTLLAYDAKQDTFTTKATFSTSFGAISAAGDLDGDLKQDLVVLSLGTAGATTSLTVWGMDKTSAFVVKKTLAAVMPSSSVFPTLITANVDDDSLVVAYTGKTELTFSKPQLIAVMAAPPTHEGIDQNLDASGTTFGTSKSLETEAGASIGLGVGFSVGGKGGFKLFGNGVEVEAKRTFKASMNWTATATASFETSVSYTGGADEDKVVFSSVPVDVYYYKVLSSPDPKAVGQTITINLPRKPQVLSVSRSFYNANNGDAMDVDSSILSHTIGKPHSYPTKTQMLAATKLGTSQIGFVNPNPVTVGQGSGVQTMTINASAGVGLGVEIELSSETEAQLTAGPLTVGASQELKLGVSFSVTASAGLFMEGTIGDIPAASYTSDKMYRAGLFAHSKQVSGQSFMVINYWVE